MTDESTEKSEATETKTDEKDEAEQKTAGSNEILDEVSRLGQKLGQAVQDVWDQEQRRAIRAKVVDELRTAGDQVQTLAKDLRTGKVGGKDIQSMVAEELRQAKGQVEHLAKEVSSSKAAQELSGQTEKIGRKLGEGLLSGLRALNRELGKALEPDGDKKDEGDKPHDSDD